MDTVKVLQKVRLMLKAEGMIKALAFEEDSVDGFVDFSIIEVPANDPFELPRYTFSGSEWKHIRTVATYDSMSADESDRQRLVAELRAIAGEVGEPVYEVQGSRVIYYLDFEEVLDEIRRGLFG